MFAYMCMYTHMCVCTHLSLLQEIRASTSWALAGVRRGHVRFGNGFACYPCSVRLSMALDICDVVGWKESFFHFPGDLYHLINQISMYQTWFMSPRRGGERKKGKIGPPTLLVFATLRWGDKPVFAYCVPGTTPSLFWLYHLS